MLSRAREAVPSQGVWGESGRILIYIPLKYSHSGFGSEVGAISDERVRPERCGKVAFATPVDPPLKR
jgi:hypothetical protein